MRQILSTAFAAAVVGALAGTSGSAAAQSEPAPEPSAYGPRSMLRGRAPFDRPPLPYPWYETVQQLLRREHDSARAGVIAGVRSIPSPGARA
jgi:hypothetical protein